MKVLITGATGFIGKRLTRALYKEGHEICLLVRKTSLEKAKSMFEDLPGVQYISGDITKNDVIDSVTSTEFLKDIEAVIHLAAYYDLRASLTEAYTHNVIGTQNLLFLMQKMKQLKIFHYISTYAVSGLFAGEFSEDQLNETNKFPDYYSKTKMQAEFLVRNANLPNVKIRIYRPGIIVGDSETGDMEKIDGPYYFFSIFQRLKSWKIPVKVLPVSYNPEALIQILPVDTLVSWLNVMINKPTDHEKRTYHLLPTEKIYIQEFIKEGLKEFNLPAKLQWIPFPTLYAKVLPLFKVPEEVSAYMHSRTRYSQKNFKHDYPELVSPGYKKYLPKLIRRYGEMKP